MPGKDVGKSGQLEAYTGEFSEANCFPSTSSENLKIDLSDPHVSRIFWERMLPNPATICSTGMNYREGNRNVLTILSRNMPGPKDKKNPRLTLPHNYYMCIFIIFHILGRMLTLVHPEEFFSIC